MEGVIIVAYAYQTPDIQNIICYLRRSRQDIERERKTGEDTLSTQRNMAGSQRLHMIKQRMVANGSINHTRTKNTG